MFSREFDLVINEVLSQELKILKGRNSVKGLKILGNINQVLPSQRNWERVVALSA